MMGSGDRIVAGNSDSEVGLFCATALRVHDHVDENERFQVTFFHWAVSSVGRAADS